MVAYCNAHSPTLLTVASRGRCDDGSESTSGLRFYGGSDKGRSVSAQNITSIPVLNKTESCPS